jgi:predicted anti-sigma-YlaC factor YlaD
MRCKQVTKKLIFYIEKELDVKEAALIQNHLEECPKCKLLYYQLEQSLNLINEDKLTESNPFFVTRVTESIKSKAQKNTILGWFSEKQYVLQTSLYIILIILALFTGRHLGTTYEPAEQASAIDQVDTNDYQLFADSYNYNFDQNVYILETADDEE